MITITKRLLLISVVGIYLGGCSHHYVPDPSTFDFEEIDEFVSTKSITIVNDQPFADDVLFLSARGHDHYGNFQKWTEIAIVITKRELTKRGMNVVNKSPKLLKMAIMSAEGSMGFWQAFCEISLKVETGNGYVNTYFAKAGSPATIYRPVDGAVMRVVAVMLRDQKIIRYLQE